MRTTDRVKAAVAALAVLLVVIAAACAGVIGTIIHDTETQNYPAYEGETFAAITRSSPTPQVARLALPADVIATAVMWLDGYIGHPTSRGYANSSADWRPTVNDAMRHRVNAQSGIRSVRAGSDR